MASFEPSGRGALRRVPITVAIATSSPSARHSSALARTSSIYADPRDMDALDELLVRVDAGELGDPLPVLAYIAGQAVEGDEADRTGARRRALLLAAAGGDPHRELGVDDRAVKALAAD